jgi:hypothetical protein
MVGQRVILCLYVDDILIFGTSHNMINEVKTFLCQSFDMKDLGETDVILNSKLIKGDNGITLMQSHYVEKVFVGTLKIGYPCIQALSLDKE